MPVYYVNRILRGPETRYSQAEKLVLALIHTAPRLKPYFLAHHICLRTDQPLRQVLSRPEASGRLTKWAIELGEYDLSYESRTAIKAQALADFLAELTFDEVKETTSAAAELQRWILHVDGSSNSEGSRAGLLLEDPQGEILGEYEAREEVMNRYLSKTVLIEVLAEPRYKGEVVYPIYLGDIWMEPLIRFLSQGELPEDRAELRKLQRKAARYAFGQNLLYKRSYLGPWLRCITQEEGNRILQDIHEGFCGAHVGYRMLVKKVLLLGYFWPTMRVDTQVMVLSCPSCQYHAPEHHQPTNFMIPITSPWPFEQWGTDKIGPFLRTPGNYAYVVVAVDYFTKWVESKPLRSITGAAVQKFF
nr:uncharacterized protein LOC113706104 [Coffea arabica]